MQPISWDEFRLVKALAETRSMAAASKALGVNHSTVFRRLNALEAQMGARVFERSRAGYNLTAAGEDMVALAGRMAEEIVSFERKIAGRDVKPSGELRITASDTMFEFLLAPILPAFWEQYPDIRLDIIVENRALNLSRRDADIALRAGRDPPETLVGRRLGMVNWAVYRQRGLKIAPARWIGFGEPLGDVQAARWMADSVPASAVAVRVNTVGSMLAAIRAGLGDGLLPRFIGDTVESVERVKPLALPDPGSLWLLTHADLRQAARVRAFLDFAARAITRRRDAIEGAEPRP